MRAGEPQVLSCSDAAALALKVTALLDAISSVQDIPKAMIAGRRLQDTDPLGREGEPLDNESEDMPKAMITGRRLQDADPRGRDGEPLDDESQEIPKATISGRRLQNADPRGRDAEPLDSNTEPPDSNESQEAEPAPPSIWVIVIFGCCAIATLALLWYILTRQDGMMFDVWSLSIRSRIVAVLSMVVAEVIVAWMYVFFGLSFSNPFYAYFAQVAMSCFTTTSCIALISLGNLPDRPQWRLLLAGAAGVLLASVSLVITRGTNFWRPTTVITFAVVFALGPATLHAVFSTPTYTRHEEDCCSYTSQRLRRQREEGTGAKQIENQIAVPPFVDMSIAIVFLALVLMVWMLVEAAISYDTWVDESVIPVLSTVVDALSTSGHVPSDMAQNLLDVTLGEAEWFTMTFKSSIAAGTLHALFILWKVRWGYLKMVRKMARGEDWKGKKLVDDFAKHPDTQVFPFPSQYASFFPGELFGTVLLGFLFTLVTINGLLIVSRFVVPLAMYFKDNYWETVSYVLLYTLLIIVRYVMFDCGVRHTFVGHDQEVKNPRLWGLLLPAFACLNFVLGFASGVLRWLVMFPFLVAEFFRVDVCLLREEFCTWDWSYHSFVCTAAVGHERLNPVKVAALKVLMEAAPPRAAAAAAEASGDAGATMPLISAAGQKDVEPGLEDGLKVKRSSRARTRWWLAVTLARNEGLKRERKGQLGP